MELDHPAAMVYDIPQAGTLKRKRRRRRRDKPAISARLYLATSLEGETALVSKDLLQDLFPGGTSLDPNDKQECVYIAVTAWNPDPSVTKASWAILPISASRPWNDKPLPNSTIHLAASAFAVQSFVNLVKAIQPNRTLRQNAPIEVRVSDVVPIPLDTVFISMESDAVQKLEEVQKKYGGGLANANGHPSKRAGKRAVSADDDDLAAVETENGRKQLVEDALNGIKVVHAGDMLPLSLTHPITHASAPPAKVLACEPVSQGFIGEATKIVIISSRDREYQSTAAMNRALLSPRLLEEKDDDDTSNEAFFSATELPAKPIVTSKSTTDLSNTDDLFDCSSQESDLSDDSDDMISLAKPGLADQPSGLSSALTSATPRPFGTMRTGGASTPASVFSHMSASTVRGGQAARSKVFCAQGLLEPIPNDLLHPKPADYEDEEARVYVESTALARLGCFSGDWVKIEASANQILLQVSAFAALDGLSAASWRPVKVYGLPESMSKRPQRYQVNPRHARRDSISSLVTNAPAAATTYLSPILLANLDSPSHVSILPLLLGKRASSKRPSTPRPASAAFSSPPVATEVTLRKIVTPISNERALSNLLFTSLKQHLELRQRIVKDGDLIGIPIDRSLGRSVFEGDTEQEERGDASLMYKWSARAEIDRQSVSESGVASVAWFSVESVKSQAANESDGRDAGELWGSAVSIDPTATAVRQSGDDRRKLPSATSNSWPYYLGVRRAQPTTMAGTGMSGVPEVPQPYVSAIQRRLRELVSVSMSPRAIHLGMPPLALLLTSTQRSIGKADTVRRVCADLGIHYFAIDAYDIASEGGNSVDVQTQGLLETGCERALECGAQCTVICVRHIEMLSSDRIAPSLKDVIGKARVLVATTTDVDKVTDTVRGLFTHELEIRAPDEGEREGILRDILADTGVLLSPEVDLSSIAVKTAALVAGDLVDVVDRAIVARNDRLETLADAMTSSVETRVTVKDLQLAGGAAANSLTPADFDAAVDLARKNFADAIGAPKIPNVQWSDVGGLSHVKDAVMETIQLPLSRPELFAKGLKKRSGILFYGPPGTGKTLLAKAIATEFSLNFFSVKGPELLNMYIGESEANVRRVFQRARDARPCVVFFDELDSVAPKRGNQGDSGGVMDRIVSQLLAELDGMSDGEDGGGGVFVIGATNRPDLLDQALLRPGRFDKMLYLGISDTHEKQATILHALTRKCTLDPSLSLSKVAETLPFTFTGADLYALCSDAMLKAVTRSARLVDERLAAINTERVSHGQSKVSVAYYFDHYSREEDTQVAVVEEDFLSAKSELVPSVSVDELQHYERVRAIFEGAGRKVETNGENARPKLSRHLQDSDMTVPRSKLNEMMKSDPSSMRKALPVDGGHGSYDNIHQTAAGASDADEDYVIRTDRLNLNGVGGRAPSGKGKGRGKSPEIPVEAINGVAENHYLSRDGAEDLYD